MFRDYIYDIMERNNLNYLIAILEEQEYDSDGILQDCGATHTSSNIFKMMQDYQKYVFTYVAVPLVIPILSP